jgi:uncharacterized membrane protein (DUF441 family)
VDVPLKGSIELWNGLQALKSGVEVASIAQVGETRRMVDLQHLVNLILRQILNEYNWLWGFFGQAASSANKHHRLTLQ